MCTQLECHTVWLYCTNSRDYKGLGFSGQKDQCFWHTPVHRMHTSWIYLCPKHLSLLTAQGVDLQ